MIAKKKFFYIFSSVLLLIGIFIFTLLLKDKNYNAASKPKVRIHSNKLMSSYIDDEKTAAKFYTDELIEVSGTLKEVSYLNQKTTIILNTDTIDATIICELNDSEIKKTIGLQKNQEILIKGICKGFLKDLILLNCYIDIKKTNE